MGADDFFRRYRAACRDWERFQRKRFPGGPRLSFRALQLAHYVAAHPACPLRDAAAGIGIEPPTASPLVEQLCRAGLLIRQAGRDRRQLALAATPVLQRFLAGLGE